LSFLVREERLLGFPNLPGLPGIGNPNFGLPNLRGGNPIGNPTGGNKPFVSINGGACGGGGPVFAPTFIFAKAKGAAQQG